MVTLCLFRLAGAALWVDAVEIPILTGEGYPSGGSLTGTLLDALTAFTGQKNIERMSSTQIITWLKE